ncbi:MAG: hypothetical protein ACD_63C00175G0002 [uncultured bacterium]|nr:MAG: hypothetical protein ACD_63C00175G0002 [uncultured bacterium]
MFAIIEVKGKQYKVEKGSKIQVELLHKKKGASVKFDKVLLVSDGKKVSIGTPYLKNKSVSGRIIQSEKKGKKIRIVKQKAKKRYKRTIGHRQKYTIMEVTKV